MAADLNSIFVANGRPSLSTIVTNITQCCHKDTMTDIFIFDKEVQCYADNMAIIH